MSVGTAVDSKRRKQIERRDLLLAASAALLAPLVKKAPAFAAKPRVIVADVCVYGGTSGGVAAAVQAARMGKKAIIVEPSNHLGGMTSGGLGWTDYGRKETIGGLSREFFRRVAQHYRSEKLPPGEFKQGEGWSHEPHVAEKIFNDWVREHDVQVVFASRIAGLKKEGARVRSITLDYAPPDRRGAPAPRPAEVGSVEVRASVFIDCSYEGDLMARAGVGYTTKRESAAQYGESLAGVIYNHHEDLQGKLRGEPSVAGASFRIDPYRRAGDPHSGLLPLLRFVEKPFARGAASESLQAYNFRLCLTKDEKNRLRIEPPANYDSARYELLGRHLEVLQKTISAEGAPTDFHKGPWGVVKISPVPNRKSDVNNGGTISTDLVGANYDYPEGDWATRARVWRDHEDYQRGFWHFITTDPRVPDLVRREAQRWGLPKDEFTDTGGWPFQLYVREGRRMLGEHVMTQADCTGRQTAPDAIGMGSYSLDSHYCNRFVWDGAVVNEGGFMHRIKSAYPVSYRALTPRRGECDNLLVVFCLSSSHAAYSSIRMEPVLMILGQSAATAACLAIEARTAVQKIDYAKLRERLLSDGQVLNQLTNGW